MISRSNRDDRTVEPEQTVFGIHPVLETLECRPQSIERILCVRDRQRGMGEILKAARAAEVPVTYLPAEVMSRRVGPSAVHQGVAAVVTRIPYAEIDVLCQEARADPLACLVVLDGVVDPRNLGATLRSCAGAGVQGVILGGSGTVGLTPAAIKTSAGTAERIPVARDAKIPRRLGRLRDLGFRSFGLSSKGGKSWDQLDLSGRIVIVAGGEEEGLRTGVARACDELVTIPLAAGIESLNVGVALSVLLFEALRQRRHAKSGS